MVKVSVKWNRQIFDDIEVEMTLPPLVFKAQLCSLTGVPPERQKLMGLKGGPLKDDADMNQVGLKDGLRLVLFGTAEGSELQGAREQTIFEEDLTAEQRAVLLKTNKIRPLPTGLINLGNTCYLSAVMQFFKPATELTDIIKRLPEDLGSLNGDEKLCATLRMFYNTWETSAEALPPFLVVEALRSHYPQFASRSRSGEGYAQQDAAECLSALLTSFTRNNKNVEDVFAFKFDTVVNNLEHPDEPETRKVEIATLLPCHIGTQLHPIDHLHEGIKLSLDEKLTKRSETIGRDCEYSKTMRMASLPPYLVVHFVRFEWKRAHDLSRTEAGRAKICRKVQFSLNFDAYEFCSEELKKELKVGRYVLAKRQEHSTGAKGAENGKTTDHPATLPGDQLNIQTETLSSGQYELVSVVTHQGRTTDSGHYVAWTRKDEEIWYKFDDHKVSEHRWKDIDLTGGRSDFHIAILLMYRKKVFEATAEEIQKEKEKISQETQAMEKAMAKSSQMKDA